MDEIWGGRPITRSYFHDYLDIYSPFSNAIPLTTFHPLFIYLRRQVEFASSLEEDFIVQLVWRSIIICREKMWALGQNIPQLLHTFALKAVKNGHALMLGYSIPISWHNLFVVIPQ